MQPDPNKLDLFPLSVVLFPGSRIELHIFEERYRTMIRRCYEERRRFGIVLYENNQLHAVGCTAIVRDITQRYPDGSYDIIAEGSEKFRLTEISQTEMGFFQGVTEPCPDDADDVPEPMVLRVMALYNAFLDVLHPDGHEPAIYHTRSEQIAFQIAEKAGLELQERQRLLESPSESLRMELLASHLEAAIPRMKDLNEIKRVVANDGYLPRLYRP
jgi:uncharacterized protein